AYAQPRAGQQAKKEGGQQSQRERLTDDMGDLAGFVDISPDDQHIAVRHAPRDRTDKLVDAAAAIRSDDIGALNGSIDPQLRRKAFQIAGEPAAVGGKYRRKLHPAGILSQ